MRHEESSKPQSDHFFHIALQKPSSLQAAQDVILCQQLHLLYQQPASLIASRILCMMLCCASILHSLWSFATLDREPNHCPANRRSHDVHAAELGNLCSHVSHMLRSCVEAYSCPGLHVKSCQQAQTVEASLACQTSDQMV